MGKKTSKNKVKKNSKHRQYHKLIRTRRRGLDMDQLQEDWKYVTKVAAKNVNAVAIGGGIVGATAFLKNPEEMAIEDVDEGIAAAIDVEVDLESQQQKNITISADVNANVVKSLPSTRFNGRIIREEVANNGESYCFQCGRYFIDDITLKVHQRSKLHKKKAKLLAEPMYTQADAEAAAGMAPVENSRV